MKRIALLMLLMGLAINAGAANPDKLSPDIRRSSSIMNLRMSEAARTPRVIVQYNSPPSPLDLGLLSELGSILDSLPLVNGIVAELPLPNILTLSSQANVRYISLDRRLSPTLSNAAPAVNAFAAWQSGYTGLGIGVAVIDSGISGHSDLNGALLGLPRVVWSQSFVKGNSLTND